MSTANTFGNRLKAERERSGISLETIAASTKIKRSLLADLERGDVSKWPQGIFGRAFVREYAASVGLAPEPVVAEFVQLFGDRHDAAGERHSAPEPAGELRLTLAGTGRPSLQTLAVRAASAAVEACAIVGAAEVLTWSTGSNFWTVCATTSMAYYGLAAACWDRTPLSRWLQHDRRRIEDATRTDSPGMLDMLVQRARIEPYTPGTTAEAVDVATGS
jgi:transcriptional regulator with XRE-family HTH domain